MHAQSCPTLCNPKHCSLRGSSPGIFQAKTLGWVAISYSRRSSQPRDPSVSPAFPALVDGFFTTAPSGKSNLMLNYILKSIVKYTVTCKKEKKNQFIAYHMVLANMLY